MVVVLTREFVTKKWPMWELELALERYDEHITGNGSSGSTLAAGVMLPVMPHSEGLTVEDLGDLAARVYKADGTWKGRKRPDAATLQHWAQLGKRVTGIVCRHSKQVGGEG